jgi:PAS domain S-box-containing protein
MAPQAWFYAHIDKEDADVTGASTAPETCPRSSVELLALLEHAPDGIFIADSEGCYTFVNEAGCRMLGFSREEMTGKTMVDLLTADDVERLRKAKALMSRGTTHVAEWSLRRKDGSWLAVEMSAKILPDGQWHSIVRDISARRVNESEREALLQQAKVIRDSQRLHRAVFDLLPVGVWIADRTGRIVDNNPAGERIWCGARYVPVEEFEQYKGWWLESGKPIAAEEWALARALQKGETSIGELIRIQCFDGTFKTIINSATPLRDEQGEVCGAIVVNEDITALVDAQEKLRANEHLLRTVFELLPVGLWIADRKGTITLTNPAGDRIWQGTRYVGPERFGEYKGWWLDTGEALKPEDWGIARAIRSGQTSRSELLRIQCFDGSFKTVINWAAPIRTEKGDVIGAIAVNEDITFLQHTQEQLRAAVRDREDILAVVTHDLRNPIAAILATAATIDKVTRNPLHAEVTTRELTDALRTTALRMSGLVEDLLAVTMIQHGRPMLKLEPVAPTELAIKAAEAARALLEETDLTLEVRAGADLPVLKVDVERILRVLANLLDNARKYTPRPGRILMCADSVSGGIRFSVANSGEPLPAEQLEAMFQRFWQAASVDRSGAGLGLAICRSIVEAHGGSIWAEPAQGERVRICFVLPRSGSTILEADQRPQTPIP